MLFTTPPAPFQSFVIFSYNIINYQGSWLYFGIVFVTNLFLKIKIFDGNVILGQMFHSICCRNVDVFV